MTAPNGVEVTERVDDEGRRYLFILNGAAVTQTVALGAGGHDLVADKDVWGDVALAPLQVMVVR